MGKNKSEEAAPRTQMETVTFEILKSQADRIREKNFCEPWKLAKDYLCGLYEDGRITSIALSRTSLGWLPEVYDALVKHVGRGAVSHYVREAFYLDMVSQGYRVDAVPVLKEGHLESAATRRKTQKPESQPNRQSIVVPLVIPSQWKEFGDKVFPNQLGTVIKAAAQKRYEKETGKRLPVQSRMGQWLGRES